MLGTRGLISVLGVIATCTVRCTTSERACEDDEYFDRITTTCRTCSTCSGGKVQWIPCSNFTDTVCGPKLLFQHGNSRNEKVEIEEFPHTETGTLTSRGHDTWNSRGFTTAEIINVVLTCVAMLLVAVIVFLVYRRWKVLKYGGHLPVALHHIGENLCYIEYI